MWGVDICEPVTQRRQGFSNGRNPLRAIHRYYGVVYVPGMELTRYFFRIRLTDLIREKGRARECVSRPGVVKNPAVPYTPTGGRPMLI